MIALLVYLLCALTSIACAILLLRGARKYKTPLLLWSSFCFIGLALNNIVLFVDLVILPTTIDLSIYRNILAAVAGTTMLYGLIWEVE